MTKSRQKFKTSGNVDKSRRNTVRLYVARFLFSISLTNTHTGDNTYDVKLENGDLKKRVKRVRKASSSDSSGSDKSDSDEEEISVGDKVEAKIQNKWKRGKVKKKHGTFICCAFSFQYLSHKHSHRRQYV